jgi:hypothetical protein
MFDLAETIQVYYAPAACPVDGGFVPRRINVSVESLAEEPELFSKFPIGGARP